MTLFFNKYIDLPINLLILIIYSYLGYPNGIFCGINTRPIGIYLFVQMEYILCQFIKTVYATTP